MFLLVDLKFDWFSNNYFLKFFAQEIYAYQKQLICDSSGNKCIYKADNVYSISSFTTFCSYIFAFSVLSFLTSLLGSSRSSITSKGRGSDKLGLDLKTKRWRIKLTVFLKGALHSWCDICSRYREIVISPYWSVPLMHLNWSNQPIPARHFH